MSDTIDTRHGMAGVEQSFVAFGAVNSRDHKSCFVAENGHAEQYQSLNLHSYRPNSSKLAIM